MHQHNQSRRWVGYVVFFEKTKWDIRYAVILHTDTTMGYRWTPTPSNFLRCQGSVWVAVKLTDDLSLGLPDLVRGFAREIWKLCILSAHYDNVSLINL